MAALAVPLLVTVAPVATRTATAAPAPAVRYDDLPGGDSFATYSNWPTRRLTYWFGADSADLDATVAHNALLDAMGIWSRVTALQFTPAASEAAATIRFSWGTGHHSDDPADLDFDGRGSVFGHGFPPPPTWCRRPGRGTRAGGSTR